MFTSQKRTVVSPEPLAKYLRRIYKYVLKKKTTKQKKRILIFLIHKRAQNATSSEISTQDLLILNSRIQDACQIITSAL